MYAEISPVVSPLAYSDSTISSTPVSLNCRLRTICGSNVQARSHGTLMPTSPVLSVGTVFDLVPFRVPGLVANRAVLVMARMLGHLLVQHRL